MGARRRGSRLRPRDIRRRALLPRATECTDVRGHISGATKRKEKDKKDQGKAKLSKLDGLTPPPAGDEPEVVATASRVSSPNDSVKNVPGVKQFYDTVETLYNFFAIGNDQSSSPPPSPKGE
ncbi:hypothetical protein NQZ68_028356 [Dissostichus eleginoides]|nr:hypothetical protein NQZ68_028356 [Dissostichus eleginoides]